MANARTHRVVNGAQPFVVFLNMSNCEWCQRLMKPFMKKVHKSEQEGMPNPELEAEMSTEHPDSAHIESEEERTEATEAKAKRTWREWVFVSWKKLLILAIMIIMIIAVVIDSLTSKHMVNAVRSFLERVEDNPGPGWAVFVVVYMVATVGFLPGSILTLGAGFTFVSALGIGVGLPLAISAVFIGAFMGAQLAFLGGRFVLKDFVESLVNKFRVIKAIDNVFETQGLKINFLLRLSPVVPFSAFNYVMGGTSSRYKDYAIGTIAIIPGTALYVYIGAIPAIFSDGGGSGDVINTVVITVGLLATVIAVYLITR
ncbi:unnamed protein product [Vitrella brassicaformis CCMP3155]|uniref:VTT domain-containing protein n=1 Tax=Vitrella brassicaformis (strain CCMP3155) TaxID=1169540 RepID=A0A0G4F7D4_VITBC|nr:unnamed protein product [Vitrella brassicaformis CCMP3155]|eukprot:CEM08577.1 unnamed protein product [Vitrella brassicaformis CCMP3155]